MGTSIKTHLTPTFDTVECHHCNALVADRPYPPPEDDAAWELEARTHRLGCAAILSRKGTRAAPVAPGLAVRNTATATPRGSRVEIGSTEMNQDTLLCGLTEIVKYGSPGPNKTLRSTLLEQGLAVRPSGGAWTLTTKGKERLAKGNRRP